MGCPKLTYNRPKPTLKVVYRTTKKTENKPLRCWRVDPLAEKYFSLSPYNYVANNPLKFFDPDGRTFVIYYNETKVKRNGKIKIKERSVSFQTWDDLDKALSKSNNNEFVSDVVKAMKYTKKASHIDVFMDGVYTELMESKTKIGVRQNNAAPDNMTAGGSYDPRKREIHFSNELGGGNI